MRTVPYRHTAINGFFPLPLTIYDEYLYTQRTGYKHYVYGYGFISGVNGALLGSLRPQHAGWARARCVLAAALRVLIIKRASADRDNTREHTTTRVT